MRLFPSAHKAVEHSKVLYQEGKDLYKNGDEVYGAKKFSEAMKKYKEAIDILGPLKSPEAAAQRSLCLVGFAKCQASFNENAKAKAITTYELAEKELKEFKDQESVFQRAKILTAVADIFSCSEDSDENYKLKIEKYSKALELLQDLGGEKALKLRAKNNYAIGYYCCELKNYKDAIVFCEKAQNDFKNVPGFMDGGDTPWENLQILLKCYEKFNDIGNVIATLQQCISMLWHSEISVMTYEGFESNYKGLSEYYEEYDPEHDLFKWASELFSDDDNVNNDRLIRQFYKIYDRIFQSQGLNQLSNAAEQLLILMKRILDHVKSDDFPDGPFTKHLRQEECYQDFQTKYNNLYSRKVIPLEEKTSTQHVPNIDNPPTASLKSGDLSQDTRTFLVKGKRKADHHEPENPEHEAGDSIKFQKT